MYDCARSVITLNNLNLPSYDIHSREARDQMLVNLYSLQESFTKISNRVTEKTKEQNERIEQIRARILNCARIINESENTKKAICFVSPAEYPTKYKFDPQKNLSLFSNYLERTRVNKFDLNAHYQMKHDIEQIGTQSKLELDNLYKFVFYMYGTLRSKKTTKLEGGISKKSKTETLGRIPTSIRYVDSLTVFDSHINPYRKYDISESNQKKKPTKTQKKAEEPEDAGLKTIMGY